VSSSKDTDLAWRSKASASFCEKPTRQAKQKLLFGLSCSAKSAKLREFFGAAVRPAFLQKILFYSLIKLFPVERAGP
jgi:hypothetical protein